MSITSFFKEPKPFSCSLRYIQDLEQCLLNQYLVLEKAGMFVDSIEGWGNGCAQYWYPRFHCMFPVYVCIVLLTHTMIAYLNFLLLYLCIYCGGMCMRWYPCGGQGGALGNCYSSYTMTVYVSNI